MRGRLRRKVSNRECRGTIRQSLWIRETSAARTQASVDCYVPVNFRKMMSQRRTDTRTVEVELSREDWNISSLRMAPQYC